MVSTSKVPTRRFTAFDLAGTAHTVTEYTHYGSADGTGASRAAFKSYALDSGECVNAWPDERTLLCMRSGAVLRQPEQPAMPLDATPARRLSPALAFGARLAPG